MFLKGDYLSGEPEYMLISGATLAVALYPSWATLLAAALFILVTMFLAYLCVRIFFHAKFTIGDAIASVVDSVLTLIAF